MHDVIQLDDRRKTGRNKPAGDQVYDDLARRDQAIARVRTYHQQILATVGAALPLAMDAGDRLTEFKDTAGYGRWLPFLRECDLPIRTAQIYRQLAANRAVIEEEMRRASSHFSIADALRLIRPKKRKRGPAGPVEASDHPAGSPTINVTIVLSWLAQASIEDKRRLAVALALDTAAMKKILPAKALPRDATPEQIFKRAMGLLSADEAPTTH